MKQATVRGSVFALIVYVMIAPLESIAASAPYKVLYSFGGLNERSGILWVARDAGIFQKYGMIRPSSTCATRRSACRRWQGAKPISTSVRRPELPSVRWRAGLIWLTLPA